MHNPESVLQNDTHKIPWDFEIQRDRLIPAGRPDLVLINKKRDLVNLAILPDHRVIKKMKREKNTWILPQN